MARVRFPATIEVGAGPAVLLLHGLNGFKEGWGPLPRALAAAGMRVVAVDLPGTGATPRLRRTTPRSLAASIAPLVAELAPVAVVCHSLGAQVGMLAAAARPGAVRAMALLAPWVEPRPRRLPPRRVSDLLQLPLVGRPLARLAIARLRRSPERRRQSFLTALGDPASLAAEPAMRALLDEGGARLLTADLRAMADWAASGLAFDAAPLAPRLAMPCLVAVGTLDRVTPPSGAHRLAAALPAGRLLSLPGVGHFPHLEAPDHVAAAIVAGLR